MPSLKCFEIAPPPHTICINASNHASVCVFVRVCVSACVSVHSFLSPLADKLNGFEDQRPLLHAYTHTHSPHLFNDRSAKEIVQYKYTPQTLNNMLLNVY